MRIKISSCGHSFFASLLKNNTAKAIYEALPISGELSWWGREIYFDIPLVLEEENPQKYVELGSIAYWPKGPGFCIFFGNTPINKDKIQPASPVSIFGIVTDLAAAEEASRGIKDGAIIVVEKAVS